MQHPSDRKYIPALGFHWLTPCYDAVVGATTRERYFKRELARQAQLEPHQEVLDLASGTGTLSIWLKQYEPNAAVTGVDADPAVLAIARRKAEKNGVAVRYDQAMSYHLPYQAAKFDRVLSSLFFHHLAWSEKQRTAQEVFRVLKPGGELHVADWGPSSNVLMRFLFLFIQILDGFKNTQDNISGKLMMLFEDAGFVDVQRQQEINTVFGTLALYRAVKPREPASAPVVVQ